VPTIGDIGPFKLLAKSVAHLRRIGHPVRDMDVLIAAMFLPVVIDW
jgi:hypothetical protein